MLRFFVVRLYGIRRLHGFKRNVVPSDFDVENEKWFGGNKISKKDFEIMVIKKVVTCIIQNMVVLFMMTR